MIRMLWVALCLCLFSGCGVCQSCTDWLGPVMESPNHPDYEHSPRSGSATVSPGVMEYTETEPVYQE